MSNKNLQYKQYKRLKKSLEGKIHKEYPLDRVLGSYLALCSWRRSPIKKCMKHMLTNMEDSLQITPEHSEVISTYSSNRDDYIKLIKGYLYNVEPKNIKLKRKKTLTIKNIISTIKYINKSIKINQSLKGISIKEKFILISLTCFALKVIDQLEKIELTCEKYYAFNSSYLIESFLCFYFKKRKTKTFSFQHGMYFDFKNNIPLDVINYENCCAETLLLWGEHTQDEIKNKLPQDVKTKIIGHPFIMRNDNKKSKKTDEILVLLPRVDYINESKSLLNILSSFENEIFLIRPHPSVKKEISIVAEQIYNFKMDNNTSSLSTLEEKKFKLVIAFNSTVFFESIALEQNTIYYDNNSEMNTKNFLSFKDEHELSKIIEFKKQKKNIDPSYFFSNQKII